MRLANHSPVQRAKINALLKFCTEHLASASIMCLSLDRYLHLKEQRPTLVRFGAT